MDEHSVPPDFGEVASHYEALSTQFRRVENLPTVDSGRRLLELMQQVRQDLADLQRRQHEGFAEVQRALDRITMENHVRDENNYIRSENSTAFRGEGALRPLLSLETGQEITGFPTRVDEIRSMSSNEMTGKLQADSDRQSTNDYIDLQFLVMNYINEVSAISPYLDHDHLVHWFNDYEANNTDRPDFVQFMRDMLGFN
ncbi:hypothetical protein CEP51_004306 [Fusarium floridanum]|uniref:Uncharacterized protein n=1 Tax=Fusarium floridanum TaxID=1325733 RepID=A0A428S1N2_9HYPO|nr:hypothetical protein CEP51_004306 [Fusarium floridanum]